MFIIHSSTSSWRLMVTRWFHLIYTWGRYAVFQSGPNAILVIFYWALLPNWSLPSSVRSVPLTDSTSYHLLCHWNLAKRWRFAKQIPYNGAETFKLHCILTLAISFQYSSVQELLQHILLLFEFTCITFHRWRPLLSHTWTTSNGIWVFITERYLHATCLWIFSLVTWSFHGWAGSRRRRNGQSYDGQTSSQ